MNQQQGLKENWIQFSLLVLINGFVGGMVGMERTILPDIADQEFGIAATTTILSFIVVFGITKAITNYFAGVLADKYGRKVLLIAGWIIALPIPFMLMYASHWYIIVLANVLLGINQGLAWSSTVVMKIDLVGKKNRGLAMGLNESAGYLAVGITAFITGFVASNYGLRPYPFLIGVGFSFSGLLLSWIFVKDTSHLVNAESHSDQQNTHKNIFWKTTWKDKNLGSITQAGLVNNLNDGMVWGILPLLLASRGFDLVQVGKLVAVYPIVWGFGQLFMGKLADHISKKLMLFTGMLIQGVALFFMAYAIDFVQFMIFLSILGLGTAAVYPTFLAAISDNVHPSQRAQSIGVFRLWRDLGYAVGALLTGFIADVLNVEWSILFIAAITVISSLIIKIRMK